MDQTSSSTLSANTLHCALELSKKSWLLAIQFPDREQPSLYQIEGGDTEKLMAKCLAAWCRYALAGPGGNEGVAQCATTAFITSKRDRPRSATS